MSATDELCRLLDERGVEWTYDGTVSFSDGKHWFHAWAYNDGAMCVSMGYLTPEQAIEATLDRGECHVKAAKKIGDLFGFSLSCGHSMVNPFDDRPDYCPWCGRKVVKE